MQASVYWIRQTSHTDMFSQGYVGVSSDLKKRWSDHAWKAQNAHLANAVNAYGWDSLVKEVVLIAEDTYCYDIESQLRPTNKIGWNIVAGGGKPPINKHWLGKTLSDEHKQKISAKVKEQMKDPARLEINRTARLGKPSPRKGVTVTAETRKKISIGNSGKPSKLKGTKMPEEQRNNLIATMQSQKWVCPHCNTLGFSKGAGNRWHFDNCKKKELLCQ